MRVRLRACACCGGGTSGPEPRYACDCRLPDTLYAAYSDNSNTPDPEPGNCRYPEDVITLNRCTLTEALACIRFQIDTYTLVGGSAEDGWEYSDPVTTYDDEGGFACLEAPYDAGGGVWVRLRWNAWKSDHIEYTWDCCEGEIIGGVLDGTLYYMVVEFQTAASEDGPWVDGEGSACCEFLWACSYYYNPGSPPAIPDLSCDSLEGLDPVQFMNGGPAWGGLTVGSGCGPSGLPCAYQTGDFNSGDETVVVAGFTACRRYGSGLGPPSWGFCNTSAQPVFSGIAYLDPGPNDVTCSPFSRTWAWNGALGGYPLIYWTISE